MRISGKNESINYESTKGFFERRAKRFSCENPYAVTMYQDNNPDLVRKRNQRETEKIKPLLRLEHDAKVLDIACGIGRWSDAITEDIEEYCGIDFCDKFIDIARERNAEKGNRHFYVGRSTELESVLSENERGMYNRVLLIGALMYLNDEDLIKTLEAVERRCLDETVICIREPIGINERLTLKEQFSEELSDEYNAIYRSRDELVNLFQVLLTNGFRITEEDFMFENDLNNRKETAQYYFILEREIDHGFF